MPKFNNIHTLLNNVPQDLRTIIMISSSSNHYLFAHFKYPYDQKLSLEAVAQLAPGTTDILSHSTQTLFTSEQLPIIKHLGPYRETMVVVNGDGSVRVSDASHRDVDTYLGVGG